MRYGIKYFCAILALLTLLALPALAEPGDASGTPVQAATPQAEETREATPEPTGEPSATATVSVESTADLRGPDEAQYTVRHCWLGDPDATICDDVTGTAAIGERFTYGARDEVPGYVYARTENDTLTIGADEAQNQVVLYYSRALTLTSLSAEKVYDGEPLSCNEVRLTGKLATGDALRVVLDGHITDVGAAANRFAEVAISRDGQDITQSGEYAIATQEGTLTVLPATIEITAGSARKRWDGTPLTCNQWALSSGALAGGQSIASVRIDGSQTEIGVSQNTPSGARILDASGAEVTDNYQIRYRSGTLGVTELQPLIVVAGSAAKIYDGAPLSDASYNCDGLIDGDAAEAQVRGEITDAGAVENAIEGVLITRDGREVTGEYEIDLRNGTLAVHPVAIEITAGSATKEYDGTALSCDDWALTQGALVQGESIRSVTVTGSQTEVGKGENVPSDAVIEDVDGVDVTANYEIHYVPGRLRVTDRFDDEAVPLGDDPELENLQ